MSLVCVRLWHPIRSSLTRMDWSWEMRLWGYTRQALEKNFNTQRICTQQHFCVHVLNTFACMWLQQKLRCRFRNRSAEPHAVWTFYRTVYAVRIRMRNKDETRSRNEGFDEVHKHTLILKLRDLWRKLASIMCNVWDSSLEACRGLEEAYAIPKKRVSTSW